MIAAIVSAMGTIRMAAKPQIRRPVVHFIHFYTHQDEGMGVFPRAVYSWLLAKEADY